MSTSPIRKPHLDSTALWVLLSCCTLWGLNQVAVKAALPEVPPMTQLAVRSVGATLLVLLWAHLRGVPMNARDGTAGAGLLAGVLFAAEFACIFIGLQFTSASRMTVFLYLAPFVVALGMPFIARGERLSALQWLGLAVAFGGVAVAFAEGLGAPSAGARQWLGDALGVAAAVLWAATTLLIRSSRLAGAAPEKTLAYQLGVTAVLSTSAVLLSGATAPATAHVGWSALSVGSLLFQTVIVTFASYLAWFWLVQHYAATRLATFTLLTPVAGLVFGVLLLAEPLTASLLIGLAAVATGIALVNRPPVGAATRPTSSTS